MICVTGRESTVQELAQRLDSTASHPDLRGRPLLQEVRLDALKQVDNTVFELLRRHASHLLACCRPTRQGGWFSGAESERLALLEWAVQAGVAWVDLESDLEDAVLRSFQGRVQRCLSLHDFEGGTGPDTLDVLAVRGTEAIKLAVAIQDAADLAVWPEAVRRVGKRCVFVGMGDAGLLSRCRYRDFGSAWTYVAAGAATAPGQLSLQQALEMGLPQSAQQPFLALVGGPQVMHSPGMKVYNRLFRKRGLPWSYLPVITQHARPTFQLLQSFGALGLSVTMPHKAAAAADFIPDQVVVELDMANSVRFEHGWGRSTNTDVPGILEPLRKALAQIGGQANSALILGSGGAAVAAVVACRALGLPFEWSARSSGIPWEERAESDSEVLINATSVSGGRSPWPEGRPLNKRIVFDLAITGQPSVLLEQAAREGAVVLGPESMWVVQGAYQISWITGQRFRPEELEEFLT